MRLAFAGTPEFARSALHALADAGHEIALVLTQPDRPAGRGLKMQASAVKVWAQARGVPVLQPRSLRTDGRWRAEASAAQAQLRATAVDALVVAAYGLILPPWVLEWPPLGAINIHASLLPRWRGAAPIQRAIEAGDTETGITIMQMDAGLDTGAMLQVSRCAIAADDSSASLHERLAALGAQAIVEALARAASWQPQAQPAVGVSYAHKIDKAEAALDWSAPAAVLERRIRAFDPFPGAQCDFQGQRLKVWRAQVLPNAAGAAPGTWLGSGSDGLVVACGDGALRITEVQAAGGRRMPVRKFFLAGRRGSTS